MSSENSGDRVESCPSDFKVDAADSNRLVDSDSVETCVGFTSSLQAQPGGGGPSTGGEKEPDEWGYYTAGGQSVTIPRSVLNKRGCLDVKKEKVKDECPNIQSTSCPATHCWTTRYYCVAFTIPPGPGDQGVLAHFR